MIRLLIPVVLLLSFASPQFAQSNEINVIPKPQTVSTKPGAFRLTKKTRIHPVGGSAARQNADVMNNRLADIFGFRLKLASKPREKNVIVLRYGDFVATGAYNLIVEPDYVQLVGSDEAGMFYALQSFLQLLPESTPHNIQIPLVSVTDTPRFPYRGMHLDVGRHYMPVSFIKKYIDLMSQYKFNYFHWHLTEDQGWRIEIKKYPKLTQIGSKRPETVKERNLQPYIGDGIPVEGFYTQEEIKDVVAYAKTRYITVVPEIELPGHSSAALAAYPEFGCKTDYQYKVQTTWGIFKEVFCPTDATFKFLEDVLDETIALFTDSPYIHIGGDEVLKDHWKESAFVQELKKRENLKDENEVQSYFIRRIEKFVNSKGKRIIGWDEILEGGLAPNAVVMSWRGTRGGIEAAKAKHEVIMTPTDAAYLNFGQGDFAFEPISFPEYLPMHRVYNFDPVPKELTSEEAKYVIGAQGNLWTEYIKTPQQAEYQLFPRMLALAEVAWSQPEHKNYDDFLRRLTAHLPRLDKQNVNYRIPEPWGLENKIVGADGKARLQLKPFLDASKIYFTLDGATPTEQSPLYSGAIDVELKPGEMKQLKTVVVHPNGRRSSVYAATLVRRVPLRPTELSESKPGVNYTLLVPGEGEAASTSHTGESRSILLNQFATRHNLDPKKPFTVTYDGYFNAPRDGIYEFQVDSTWDASVTIGGEKIIDDIGTKDRKVRHAIIPLMAGPHKISLRYNHRGSDASFRLRWAIKGEALRQAYGGEFVTGTQASGLQ